MNINAKQIHDTSDAAYVKTDCTGAAVINGQLLAPVQYSWTAAQATAPSATAVHAAAACAITAQTVTTSITNPSCARVISATTSGTSADVAAVSVIVYGTDINDQYLTETLPAFTVNTNETVTGTKAFKTITSYYVPAMDGTGCNVSIGVGAALGLPVKLSRKSIVYKQTFFGTTLESTEPTLTISSSVLASNTITLNSTLDGTAFTAAFYLP